MIVIREVRDSDRGYVAATALHQMPRFVRHVERDEMALVLRGLLNASRIVVACSEADEDTLLGWAAAIGGVPWFVFVTRELRANGIGTKLRLEVMRGRNDQAGERGAHRQHDAGDVQARGVALGFFPVWRGDS